MRLTKTKLSSALEVFVHNAVWSLLIAPLGGVVLGILKANQSAYEIPTLYGLIGCFVILGIMALAVYIASVTAGGYHRISAKNASAATRELADKLGIQIQKVNGPPELAMNYILTLTNGRKIVVKQMRDHPYFLHLSASVTYDDNDNKLYSKLPEGTDEFLREMRLHLSVAKVGFEGISFPLKEITLAKAIPISPGFGEVELLNAISEMDMNLGLLIALGDVRGRVPVEESRVIAK